MMNSKGFEFSFGWLFAIIVGAAIIALAIYATTNFIETERNIEDSTKSLELSAILRELETGLERSGVNSISTQTQTRINNGCSISGNTVSENTFGVQTIRTSTSSSIGDEWNEEGIPLRSSSIYLFSNKSIEGEEFVVLSQRFEYPYKIADIISIWPASEKYCFVNAPVEVENSLQGMQIPGVNYSLSVSRCQPGSKKVCFAQGNCDMDVSISTKTVSKKQKSVYFDEVNSALFYAAIFSDPEIYDCQVSRLAKKAGVLAQIYSEKARFGMAYGCGADILAPSLDNFGEQLSSIRNSQELMQLLSTMEGIKRDNDALICPVF